MIWFTSDTHFGHRSIIDYCKRPFKNVDEMDGVLIKNWNNCVKKNDTIYHLGDFSFQSPEKYTKQLNGQIHLILGNHDHKRMNSQERKTLFTSVSELKQINIGEQTIVLCHYSMRVWSKSHYGAWHLFGHSHGCLSNCGKSFDVGVDCNDYTPLSYEMVKRKMDSLGNNYNWVENMLGFNKKDFEDNRNSDE